MKIITQFVLLLCVSIPVYANDSVCFTPGEDCISPVVQEINRADHTIIVQAYYLTSQPIIDALINADHRGVVINVLLDKTQCPSRSRTSAIPKLIANNISVAIDYKPAIAHNKVIIIDNNKVIGGSFNYTDSAQKRNAENLIIIDDKDVVSRYIANYIRRLNESMSYMEYHNKTGC